MKHYYFLNFNIEKCTGCLRNVCNECQIQKNFCLNCHTQKINNNKLILRIYERYKKCHQQKYINYQR